MVDKALMKASWLDLQMTAYIGCLTHYLGDAPEHPSEHVPVGLNVDDAR